MRILFVQNSSCLLAFYAIFLVLSPAFAGTAYQEITAPEVKLLQEKGDDVLLVMVLSELQYELHHIPGSVNIPIDTLENSSLLPADKNRPLVFYCMGSI